MLFMTIKIKKLSIKMSIAVAVFLFACNSGNRPPTLADIQREHTSSVTTTDPETEIIEDNTSSADRDADDRPRNTEWADAEGNPRYDYIDVYGRQHTQNYFLMDEKPLFNGKDAIEELNKYILENNKFKEIAEENNIQDARIVFELTIGTDGSTIDAIIREGNTHQVFGDEVLRLLNSMHEHGKWTPGKHDGEVMKARIPYMSFSFVAQ